MRTILATAFGLALCTFAYAHSWYPIECCSENDCHRMTVAAKERGDLWVLPDGRVWPKKQARMSPDEDFHVCEIGQRIICFYAPVGGY